MKRSFLPALFLLLSVASPPLEAQEIPYDRYTPLWASGPLQKRPDPTSEALQSLGKHFLVYPFELVRWPVDKTLVFIEDHRVVDKVDWIYEQLTDRGMTPRIGSILGGGRLGGGFDLEWTRLFGLKDEFPNFTVEGTGFWTFDHITDYGLEVKQEQIGGSSFFLETRLNYANRGEEHFYGIGPDTSLGDGTSYRNEQTLWNGVLGYDFFNTWALQGEFAFQNVNITNGEDGGRGVIDEIFVATGRQRIPGLSGDEILSWALELEHDTRDNPDLPSEGGYQRLHASFHKGLDHTTGFFKYRAEAAHFIKVFSKRQVVALRGLAEHNDEVRDREVPFFQMARLGGYGTYPRLGDAHRGFERDRFYDESLLLFTLEYRWTIWEYRDWKMDSVLFWDHGQVFGEWSELQLKDFEPSYGLGFRISFAGEVILVLELAHSDEGTQFYAKTKAPF